MKFTNDLFPKILIVVAAAILFIYPGLRLPVIDANTDSYFKSAITKAGEAYAVINDSLAQCQSSLANLTDAQASRLATLAATQEALAKEQNALDVCLAAAAPPASVPHPVAKPWHRAPLHNPLDDAYDPLAGHCR